MNIKKSIKSLGPGLLWAGAAIGVSHLVQATRAGAMFGFQLAGIILLFNLIKYPFFEFGPRYAASTGESLLDGYKRLGNWAIILYFIATIATMFTLQAAITVVTGGLFSYIFPGIFSTFTWTILILLIASLIITIGKYAVLDKVIKFIIIILAISTIISVAFAISGGYNPDPSLKNNFTWEFNNIALLIAFAGWMPSAIDISVWHSFWTIAKSESTGYKPKVKEALFDFNVGYFGTAILSIGFLTLGAITMYASGEQLSSNGTKFAGQLISLFTTNLGSWAYIIIAIAGLATMSSTTLTCLDAYPRILRPATELLFPKLKRKSTKNWNWLSWFWLVILLLGTLTILKFFLNSMSILVDIATTLSFITAPILGYLNYKTVTGSNVQKEHQPKTWLKALTWIGLTILSAFAIYYIILRIFIL
ncbi:MAG: divalent metal cation transporter [Bacteroidota bacterium]|nr:divalent metal cation transporter [Bacteroidota bacterium]